MTLLTLKSSLMSALLLVAVTAQAQPMADSKYEKAAASAEITEIKGNLVTITAGNGKKRVLEVNATKGLSLGMRTGWCEEDCNNLRIGDSSIRVQRTLDAR